MPPAYLGRDYAILVPQVDADGNDAAGIRSLDVAVPLGTNTGRNYTSVPGRIDQADYVAALTAAANDLVGERFMLRVSMRMRRLPMRSRTLCCLSAQPRPGGGVHRDPAHRWLREQIIASL